MAITVDNPALEAEIASLADSIGESPELALVYSFFHKYHHARQHHYADEEIERVRAKVVREVLEELD